MPRVSRPTDPTGVVAVAPVRQSTGGGSGSFLVVADDHRRYWCKALNNPQQPRVPVNEQIVGRLGQLIGAPTCEPQLVRIPEGLADWEFRPGYRLEPSWVHGSLAVDPAVETRDLADHRTSDDNARRHAGIYALHDWLAGADAQWLMVGADREFHSHDHGHYFQGPAWTADTLQQHVAAAFPLGSPTTGLDVAEIGRLADRIEAVTEEEIVTCTSKLPAAWPVSDDELEALIDFVYARRAPVAQRLRAVIGGV